MESILSPPEPFKFDENTDNIVTGKLSDGWQKWKKGFQIYYNACELNKKAAAIQFNIFLHVVGEQCREILEQYNAITLEGAYTKLDGHFKTKKNLTVERHKFFTRSQQQNESIDQYVFELKKLAQPCEFGTLNNDLIKDKLVCGVISPAIRERLLREDDLTLDKAMEICRTAIVSRMYSERIKRETGDVYEVNEPSQQQAGQEQDEIWMIKRSNNYRRGQTSLNTRRGGSFYGARNTVRGRGGASDLMMQRGGAVRRDGITRGMHAARAAAAARATIPRATPACGRCGAYHAYGACPAYGKPCLRCSRMNHFAKVCGVYSIQAEEQQETSTRTALILLVHLSLHTVDEGYAINPSCTCVRFTSTHGLGRGTFSSPEYPRAYPSHIDCLLYTFLAAPHEIVELIFTDFDIYKGHLECTQGDYLKVYSEGGLHGPGPPGVNEYSVWSRVLCGSRADAPPALYSHGPLLVLEFHTAETATNATGFIGTFKFIDRRNFETDGVKVADSCDYVFNSQSSRPAHGRLYSPRYPSSYPSNVRCTYHFNGRQNERIKLVFEESFLQKGDESCLNRADIIKVFDGRTSSAPVLAMLCNEIIGYEILSTGPDLLVQFTANSNTPGQGFKASYQFQMEDTSADADVNKKSSTTEAISGLGPAVSAATSSCHQVFRSDKSKSGKLTSPLHPSPYPQKTQCHYDFLARGRERIRLVFEDFFLQRISDNVIDCESMDSLDVFVYVDGRLEKMASFCGNEKPKPIMSNGPKLSLEFRGLYSSRHSRGFKISYSFVEDYGIATGSQLLEFPCAFIYNSSESFRGVVTSPNYPGLYPRDTECNYFFYGHDNERIHLHFTHFDVEGVVPCEAISASDYVQFSSQMIDSQSNRHCGQLRELLVTSEKNFLRLTFKSNDRLDGTGFRADYIFLRDSEMNSITMPEEDNESSSLKPKFIILTICSAISASVR